MAETPTYRETEKDGSIIYTCLYCEGMGTEHWARDFDDFKAHMLQRHDGKMVPAEEEPPREEAPA